MDIAFIAINLLPEQRDWLDRGGIRTFTQIDELPRFSGAPDHAYSLTCRPYLPWILPEYDGFVWVDSDIRFLVDGGLTYYLQQLSDPAVSIVAAQETEAAYCVNADPRKAYHYHTQRIHRLAQVYGPEVMKYCQYYTPFNAGLFAARADSPVWPRYRRNLGKALGVPFDGMLEQDALNVSMLEVGGWARAPSVMNWLCSLSLPVKAEDGTWRHPDEQSRRLFVAHLTSMTAAILLPEGPRTYYDVYRALGLTD